MSDISDSDGMPPFSVRRADWEQDQIALKAVRRVVFIIEQSVPAELEWDGLDAEAVHLLAEDADRQPIGTCRLLPSGQIGRIAVLKPWRGRGAGRALLSRVLRVAAEEGFPTPYLDAQLPVVDLYRGFGFQPHGEIFDEAGMPHQRMRLDEPEVTPASNLAARVLGRDAGVLQLEGPGQAAEAIAAMAGQARRTLSLLAPSLEPEFYDQPAFLQALRQLAVERSGHLPVRVLVVDAESAIRRSLRLIELARRLTSSMRIAMVPEELAEDCDAFLLVDDQAYFQRRRAVPTRSLVDFADPARTRILQRQFETIWGQAGAALELQRLYL